MEVTGVAGYLYTLPADLLPPLAESEEEARQGPGITRHLSLSAAESGLSSSSRAAPEGREHSTALTCVTCGLGPEQQAFATAGEQTAHFRSDWHRLNVKRRGAGRPTICEPDFDRMVADRGSDLSSISGSDSEGDEAAALDKQPADAESALAEREAGRLVYKSQSGKYVAVWQALLAASSLQQLTLKGLGEQVRSLQGGSGVWAVFLSSGGHFAGAVSNVRVLSSKGKLSTARDALALLEHKTIHRYVVRAKAGGRQSTNDASKFAKSAGAQIRRHNEAQLEQGIRETILSWKAHLARADFIFVHATGPQAAFYGGKEPALNRQDPRLRRVPFPIRRPTLSEARRVLQTLASVYSVTVSEAERGEAPKGAAAEAASSARGKGASAPKKEEKEEEPVETPLHTAARAGNVAEVSRLLEGGADPTAFDRGGRTPYAVAGDKAVRDAFRRAMAGELQDKWDWGAAGVPSALTAELEAAQAAKLAEKKQKLREREKEKKRQAGERRAKAAAEAAAQAQTLLASTALEAAALPAQAEEKAAAREGKAAREARQARERRELLAAAAEARMLKLQQQPPPP